MNTAGPAWAGKKSGMVRAALLVYCLDQHRHLARVDMLVDTVAEVEHEAGTRAVVFEDGADLGADALGRGIKNRRVHVALERDFVAHTRTRVFQIRGPVETEGVAAG